MKTIFAVNKKKFLISFIIFVSLTIVTTVIVHKQMLPFAIKVEITELQKNNIGFCNIFIRNIMVCTIAMSGVFLLRVPAILILLFNSIVLGFILGINWASTGELLYFVRIIIPHAIFEISAISISCVLGFEGRKLLNKYNIKQIIRTILLVIILLFVAGIVECYISILFI